MNSKDKSNAINTTTFSRLHEEQVLLDAATKGSKIRLTYPMAKRGQKTVYTTLEDGAELPHYVGKQPTDGEGCTCLMCVFKHGRFGRGRN
jgi:hypothetical protein